MTGDKRDARQLRVLRAVIAVKDFPSYPEDQRVLPFHVVYFGIPECVRDVSINLVSRDMRDLERVGLLKRFGERGRRVDYLPTPEGREYAA